ncbi:hypothetical protein AAHA92_12792 [Salvia divinorum]|uniref:F-box domain-containing protein n=1 Tax=Salvia divinorum TaxID=28513 RepID=A0ABD1H663_SALDI
MEEEEDRMSQLPDDILLLILDKIGIFQAIETTILSNRWKNLWCSLPALRFHLNLETEFVSHFLSHRDAAAAVHDFHLFFDSPSPYPQFPCGIDREFIEECVIYAINHGVQSLLLRWPTYREVRLPAAFLTCKTLQELELRNLPSSVQVPGRLSLPNLKTFHLETVLVFDDDHHMMEPFSGLPELEKLTLGAGYWIGGLVIKAPKLRVLEIYDYDLKVKEISAPQLTSFRYKSFNAWECAKVNLPVLEQVYLDIHETCYHQDYMHNNFVRMLHQFGNATTVSLNVDILMILECKFGSFEQTPPPFPNMKCLKVIDGHNEICTVIQRVINYLTSTLNCEVELSPGLFVGEHMTDEETYFYKTLILRM